MSAAPSVTVVGAGAAGLVAAAFAAASGAKTTLLERTRDGGRKILISGGGRCNVLPSVAAPERFVTESPKHLLRAMLRSWPLQEQRAFFENELGIPLALEPADSSAVALAKVEALAEAGGKLFPRSNRARDVRDALVTFALAKGVDLRFNTTVINVSRAGRGFAVETSGGTIACDRVVLATGGLSVPATGSDGIGLRIARALGHDLVEPYPALTPLVAGAGRHASLSGVSLNVRLRSKDGAHSIETHGGFLFTHRGYSGPSVLDISHVTARGESPVIRVQWAALKDAALMSTGGLRAGLSAGALAKAGESVAAILSRHVPGRLAEQLMTECGIPLDRRTSSLKRAERVALVAALTSYPLPWSGNEGYQKAEVTGGGVRLADVDLKTLESRKVEGLYLCGEMLDAFGPIGGHNFSWAWSTGRAAGIAAGNLR
jgi:predicted Rossmann fold flavoprotein